MSHKTEAEKWLAAAVSPETEKSPAGYAAAEMMTARAQVLATLALVDAQEAANEQARIANLIALAGSEINDVIGDPSFDPAAEALLTLVSSFPIAMDDAAYGFAPHVAAALGIGGDA